MSISQGTFIKFVEGNPNAVEKVYLEYKNLMYFVIASYVPDQYDVEDIMSDAVIKARKNSHTIKNHESLKSFLASVAKNQALDFLRKQREVPSSDTIDEMYGEEDRTNALLSMFEPLLTNKETIVTYLKIGFSFTWPEIAKETSMSESTARRLYDSAIKKLRKGLR